MTELINFNLKLRNYLYPHLHSSRVKSTIKMLAGPCSFWREKKSFLVSSWFLVCSPWNFLACGNTTLIAAFIIMWLVPYVSLSLQISLSVLGYQSWCHLNPLWPYINLYLERPHFQIQSHSLGIRTSIYFGVKQFDSQKP